MGHDMEEREDAFAVLYARYYGAVYAFAARRVGTEAADEIAADTFLIAWRRWEAIPAESLPWLYGVARNVLLRHRETSARQRRAQDALLLERSFAAENVEFVGDPVLWTAWARLREADQDVLALVAWEELSVAEAALVLGCSAPVFSVRLHRARRRLAHLLATSPMPLTATIPSES
jgi:RNA polymerase sigma-70 factor (ECF subfamily)